MPEGNGRSSRLPPWCRRIPWLAVIAFALTTFALLPRPLLGLRTFGAVDMLEPSTPYRESLGRKPEVKAWLQTDQVEGFPEKVSFWRDLRNGDFQTWSRRVAGGTPTGVFPFNAILSPFSVGFAFLPAWYALSLSAALALLASQIGMYLFLRRLGVVGAVAVLGAVAYTFSGANVVNLHRVTAPFVLPLLLWAVDRLVDRPSWRRAAVVGVMVAWTWMEGFPFGFVVCTGVAVAWGLWRATRQWFRPGPDGVGAVVRAEGRSSALGLLRRWAWVGAGVAWGLAVAAFSLAPTLYEISQRGTLDIRDYSTAHLSSLQLMGLFNTRALGRWQENLWTGEPFATETATTVGLMVTAGVVVACAFAARRRLRLSAPGRDAWGFWIVTGGAVTLLTFANTPLLALAQEVPGLAHNRMSRARFLIPLAAAIVAALGLDALLRRKGDGDERRPPSAVVAAVALVAGAAACILVVPRWLAEGARLDQLRPTLGPLLLDGAITVAAIALVAAAVRWRRLLAPLTLAVVALLWVQLAWPLREITPAAPVSDFYRVTDGHRAMAARLDDRYRFVGSGLATFYSGSSEVFDIDDLRGFALRTTAARNLVMAVSPQAFALDDLKIVLTPAQWNLTSPVLDDLAVRFFAMGSHEPPVGVVRQADPDFDRWAPAADPTVNAEPLRAGGPVMGVALPIRTSPSCGARRLTVRLRSGGQVLGTASRPASDANGSFIPFAIDGQAMTPGQPYGLSVEGPGGDCAVEVGASDGATGAALAAWEMGPDPALPLRLVSATDGWVYERTTAWPLVSAHTRWRAFPDQASLLAWLVQRPPAESDVAGYVGPERSPERDDGPERPVTAGARDGAATASVHDVRWDGPTVALTAEGDAPSLVVFSQNADPGWSVEVDGKAAPLIRVDGALQGVFVPAGRHRVVFSYREPVLRAGAAISGLALSAVAVVAVAPPLVARRRRRAGQHQGV